MDESLRRRLDAYDQKLDAIYATAEKTRKYFLWTLIISVVMILVPLIGLIFAVPAMLHAMFAGLGAAGVTPAIPTDSAGASQLIRDAAATLETLQ